MPASGRCCSREKYGRSADAIKEVWGEFRQTPREKRLARLNLFLETRVVFILISSADSIPSSFIHGQHTLQFNFSSLNGESPALIEPDENVVMGVRGARWENKRRGGGEIGGREDGRTGGREDGRTGGREDGRTGGREDRRTGGWEDGRTGGREDGRTGGREDGRTGGREDGRTGGREDGTRETGGREDGTRDTGHGTRDTGHGTRDTGHGTRDTGHGTRDTGHGTRDTGHGTRDTGHGTRDTGHGTREDRRTRTGECEMGDGRTGGQEDRKMGKQENT
ncbi:hypothetical protein F4604DRAFT_1686331 [Suillus subluteus]|nr:hypothetical protein F4604DRAFT_1686331 [Suillus subluteus]